MKRILVAITLLASSPVLGNTVVASFYGAGEALSSHTASGARFNPSAMTCAHKTLPFGTKLRVCKHGCVVVTVNDRGPFVGGRTIDLAAGPAKRIGLRSTGVVTMSRVN